MDFLISWLSTHGVQLAALLPLVGITVPSAQAIADKWVRVTSGRATDYATGVANAPPAKYEANAKAAAGSWAAGLQQAISENRYAVRIDQKGTKWQRNATGKGQARFGDGVTKAHDDMATGIGPYVAALQAVTLDPRGPRGDPRNLNRVAAIMNALNQARRAKK